MTAPASRREARRAATRRAIQEHALRLFLAKGYEATTVEQISAAADVSHMTFFRYFPTKESVVDTDDYDPMFAELIRRRPAAEDPLTAICRAAVAGLAEILPTDAEALLVRSRLILRTPALRARQADNQFATQVLIADALTTRAGIGPPTFEIDVLAAAAVAALTTAIRTWAAADDTRELISLINDAFAVLRAAAPGDRRARGDTACPGHPEVGRDQT